MIVEFPDAAQSDLEQITDYIARDDPRRALSFVQELRGQCQALTENPLTFSLMPRYEGHGIRRRVHGNDLIFYRVEESRIVILHILNGAMDYAAIFFEKR